MPNALAASQRGGGGMGAAGCWISVEGAAPRVTSDHRSKPGQGPQCHQTSVSTPLISFCAVEAMARAQASIVLGLAHPGCPCGQPYDNRIPLQVTAVLIATEAGANGELQALTSLAGLSLLARAYQAVATCARVHKVRVLCLCSYCMAAGCGGVHVACGMQF